MKSLVAESIQKAKQNPNRGTALESWIHKRLRLGLPVNDPSNLIRISAQNLLKLHNYKMDMLGSKRSLLEESEDSKERLKTKINE